MSGIEEIALGGFSIPPSNRNRFRMISSSAARHVRLADAVIGERATSIVALILEYALRSCMVSPNRTTDVLYPHDQITSQNIPSV